jgi:ribosome modulation factor
LSVVISNTPHQTAYEEGMQAAIDGKDEDANPYEEFSGESGDWLFGFITGIIKNSSVMSA